MYRSSGVAAKKITEWSTKTTFVQDLNPVVAVAAIAAATLELPRETSDSQSYERERLPNSKPETPKHNTPNQNNKLQGARLGSCCFDDDHDHDHDDLITTSLTW